ncbi:immunoglobulin kappa light chain-like [Heterodontus francisci]|uniref:immunoglobulin kappa light chain-like n=1 Tax=Heterodontus francisci TaxID=7792 RepID=UPI00355C0441
MFTVPYWRSSEKEAHVYWSLLEVQWNMVTMVDVKFPPRNSVRSSEGARGMNGGGKIGVGQPHLQRPGGRHRASPSPGGLGVALPASRSVVASSGANFRISHLGSQCRGSLKIQASETEESLSVTRHRDRSRHHDFTHPADLASGILRGRYKSLSFHGISGDIIMTQSPPALSVTLGQTATITCTASQSVSKYAAWYQQRDGQKPTLLIYGATTRYTGISERFTGSQQNLKFTLTISNVQNEDVADYYCQQYSSSPYTLSVWLTFGKGTKLRLSREKSQPTLTLLPPSEEEVKAKGTATLVCLADHFYPDEVGVEWKKDGAVISAGVQTSNYLRASDSTYSVSSLLTLSGSDWESNARFSCALIHETLSSPLSKSVSRSECV